MDQDLLIIALAGLMIVRQLRGRSVDIRLLWLLPALAVALSLEMSRQVLSTTPYSVTVLALALVIGASAGLLRWLLMDVRVDRAARLIHVKGSILGACIWVVLFGARVAVHGGLSVGADTNTINLITAAFAVSLAGAMIVGRLYLLLRYFHAQEPATDWPEAA